MAKTRSRATQTQQNQKRQPTRQKNVVQSTPERQAIPVEETKAPPQVIQVAETETVPQAEPQALVIVEERAVTTPIPYPSWPTSRPGPRATPPPPGTRPVNALRPEQVAEIGYNQETGEPGDDSLLRSLPDENLVGRGQTSFDQPRTAQEEIGKRKKRL